MSEQLVASDKAFKEIVSLVMNHTYKPGDRLFETVLSTQLGLSRTPVRMALAKLVSMQFLDKKDGERGYSIPLLTPDDMFQAFQTRAFLESQAIASATLRMDNKNIRILEDINAKEKEAFMGGNRFEYSVLNEQFHFVILDYSENIYFARLARELLWRCNLYSFFFANFYHGLNNGDVNDSRRQRSFSEHAAIIDALKNRDANEAENLMFYHVKNTYEHMLLPETLPLGNYVIQKIRPKFEGG